MPVSRRGRHDDSAARGCAACGEGLGDFQLRRAISRADSIGGRITLNDTLIIWTGEFGRTPDNDKRGGVYSLSRGHNNKARTMPFVGGGVKKGIVGATRELGSKAMDIVHPIRDLHVTLLNMLGVDGNKLTYYHAGRYKQLSRFGGRVIKELIT